MGTAPSRNETPLQVYQHSPLRTDRHQIRLVKFGQSQSHEQPISFHIEAFDTETCPEYVALSYRWGSPDNVAFLINDQTQLKIRRILFEFLQEIVFRPPKDASITGHDETVRHRWFWVDQVCIDQDNIAERNEQVQQMPKIFGGAVQVWAWLDPPDDTLERIAVNKNRSFLLYYELGEKPYWKRLWIVQELFLAKSTVFVSGRAWVNYLTLEKRLALFQIHESSMMNKVLSTRFSRPYGGHKHYTLFAALLKFRQSECEDPRDRIYGLMSLVEPEERLEIDYAKPIAEVCRETVQMLKSRGFPFDHSHSIDVFNLGERLHVWDRRRHYLDEHKREFGI